MYLDLWTVLVVRLVLSLVLAAMLMIGVRSHFAADGVTRRWVQSLLVVASAAAIALVLADSFSPWITAVMNVGLALSIGLQSDAVNRLGGRAHSQLIVVLPALVLAIASGLAAYEGDEAGNMLIGLNVTALQWFALAWLALLPSREVSLSGRLGLFLPLLVSGLTQMALAIDLAFGCGDATSLGGLVGAHPLYSLLMLGSWFAATLGLVLIELERTDRAVRRQARRDPLTGLLNRRAWAELAQDALKRARHEGRSSTAAVVTIDQLRLIAREEGQIAADRALVHLAHALVEAADKQVLMAGRLNGEMIALIWNEPDGPSQEQLLQLCRRTEAACEHELGFPLKVSLGLARGGKDGLKDLLAQADRARRAGLRLHAEFSAIRAASAWRSAPATRGEATFAAGSDAAPDMSFELQEFAPDPGSDGARPGPMAAAKSSA